MVRIQFLAAVFTVAIGCNEKRPAPVSTPQAPSTKTSAAGQEAKQAATKGNTMKQIKRIGHAFEPQVAGQFYDANPTLLRQKVRKFIDDAGFKERKDVENRDIVGLVAPHAGYPYSGPVAGEAYRSVVDRSYKTVIVMALNHRKSASKLAVLKRPAYDTPLGSLEIDMDEVTRLLGEHPDLFIDDEGLFRGEHSLEVQLPFIQVALPEVKIVPIIAAVHSEELVAKAAAVLHERFGMRRDVLFVASTDLTHFMPYDEAVKYDTHLLDLLEKWRIDEWKSIAPTRKGMCGFFPVLTLVDVFSKFDSKVRKSTILDYRNSGDTSGDKGRGVVGYGAMAFTLDSGVRNASGPDFGPYGIEERRYLIDLAKRSVAAAVKGEQFNPEAPPMAVLKEKGAAFVTLKKGGKLRGCIGHVIARIPLFECVASVAKSAAIHDTRFSPVTGAELDDLTFEISVLTRPEPITPDQVVVGRDGLIMSRGGYSGLLLPQVPIEWNWDREEFLSHTCRKAGLPLDCWRDSNTRIESFRAIVFGEEDIN
jgi:MEMO1 family protein